MNWIWEYYLPLGAFLLYGWEYEGTIVAKTKSEARAKLKSKLRTATLPKGTLVRPKTLVVRKITYVGDVTFAPL